MEAAHYHARHRGSQGECKTPRDFFLHVFFSFSLIFFWPHATSPRAFLVNHAARFLAQSKIVHVLRTVPPYRAAQGDRNGSVSGAHHRILLF